MRKTGFLRFLLVLYVLAGVFYPAVTVAHGETTTILDSDPDPWDVSWVPSNVSAKEAFISNMQSIISSSDGGTSNSPLIARASDLLHYCLVSINGNPGGINPAFALAMFRKEANFAKPGTIAYNNRNPGNIRCTGYYGEVGCQNGFAVFSSFEDGIKAYAWLLTRQYKPGGQQSWNCQDIPSIIRIYAPPGDGNNTEEYIRQVTTWTREYQAILQSSPPPPPSLDIRQVSNLQVASRIDPGATIRVTFSIKNYDSQSVQIDELFTWGRAAIECLLPEWKNWDTSFPATIPAGGTRQVTCNTASAWGNCIGKWFIERVTYQTSDGMFHNLNANGYVQKTTFQVGTQTTCECTAWQNRGCEEAECNQGYRLQVRSCSPSGCADERRCIRDTSCDPEPSTPTHTPTHKPPDHVTGLAVYQNYDCSGASEVITTRGVCVNLTNARGARSFAFKGDPMRIEFYQDTNCTFSGSTWGWDGNTTCRNLDIEVAGKVNSVRIQEIASTPTPTTPPPGCPQETSTGGILYRNANFDCEMMGSNSGYFFGYAGFGHSLHGLGMNDQASSIKIGAGFSVRLYKNFDNDLASICLNGNDSNFSDNRYEDGSPVNDSVTRFEVFGKLNCPNDAHGQVSVYQDASHVGYPTGWWAAGTFNIGSLLNDAISSVRVNPGWSVRVWEDGSAKGGSLCLRQTVHSFSGLVYDNGHSINDTISSVQVFNNNSCAAIATPTKTATATPTRTPTTTRTTTKTRTPSATTTRTKTATPTVTGTPCHAEVSLYLDWPPQGGIFNSGIPITFAGWAVDTEALSETGISNVKILINGGAGSYDARYGQDRPDIAVLLGERYRHSGFSTFLAFSTSTFSVAVEVTDHCGRVHTTEPRTFSVVANTEATPTPTSTPQVLHYVDNPQDGATFTTAVNFAGWSILANGVSVEKIEFYMDLPRGQVGKYGEVKPNQYRADLPNPYKNSGWTFHFDPAWVNNGTHSVYVYAISNNQALAMVKRTFTTAGQTPTPSPSPTSTTGNHIRLEAEAGQETGLLRQSTSTSASACSFIDSPSDTEGEGSTTLSLTITTEAGNYFIWARARRVGEDWWKHDSFFLQIDRGEETPWAVTTDSWGWTIIANLTEGDDAPPKSWALQPGDHTLTIRRREEGTRLDALEVTNLQPDQYQPGWKQNCQ